MNNKNKQSGADEIPARKSVKIKLKKVDYLEIGGNIIYGITYIIKGIFEFLLVVIQHIPEGIQYASKREAENDKQNGFRDGRYGYGHYENGVRVDDKRYDDGE
ncbi:hypothetical protein [Salmonella enterica]|uniref:hypothetical protein n=1 Tax=Salmonella enterica TaxID=28901 RepID=UPI0012C2621B|nr:hypothetical protein [Salmonella enterica]EBF8098480.1 hypothetical protein [Salmonella enterica subsp. enterica serovar Nigeria]EBZ0016627.1 hypothetical protein [Salmonella enterica subsp. enterica serovar Suberu]EHZ3052453.1 hypothetical protein [Salmonella enterica subsp. enterica]